MKGMIREYCRLMALLVGMWLLAAVPMVYGVEEGVASEPTLDLAGPLAQRMSQRISVEFIDTPVELVVLQLAEAADVDIVTSKGVTGNVTAKVTNIPLQEALTHILAANGWGYVQTENMIRVVPSEEIALEKEKENLKKRAREALVQERLVTKTYRIYYADVKEVAAALQHFVTKKGAVVVIAGTSNIMITETESRIAGIDEFIKEIDRITPQILVEVRIYDLTHNDQLDLGVEWAVGRNTIFNADGNPVGGRLDPFIVGGLSGGDSFTANTEASIRFGILRDSFNLDAMVRAQQEIVDAELLANPRIQVLDNETATFDSIREIPYTEQSETSMGGSMTSTRFKEVGVKLDVTPHVTRNGMIRLRVMPEFGIVVHLPENGPPTVDTRKADTIALVQDGETIVLGGLRKKESRNNVRKIPLLGDIPLLGWLFRSEGKEIINSELVVFITPTIVEQQDVALSRYEARILKRTQFEYPKSLNGAIDEDQAPKPGPSDESQGPEQDAVSLPPNSGDTPRQGFIPRL